MHTATTVIATARLESSANLRTALSRYERLSSPPRHLLTPLCGDLDAVIRAERRCRERGQLERADELADWAEREYTRRQRLATWSGRSRKAWVAAARRLESAIEWAIRCGALTGDSITFCADRLRDAQFQVQRHDLQAHLDSLN